MASFFQLKSFITYWLDAVDKHSLHSPFFYDFFTKVVTVKDSGNHAPIETLRRAYLTNTTTIPVRDLGAGADHKPSERRITDIAGSSLSTPRFSQLYARIIRHYGCKNIIELGTSLGINTLYLAQHATQITTFEGAPAIAALAKESFETLEQRNIRMIEGDISQTLAAYQPDSKIDLAFLDANHRYEPTLKYFHLLSQSTHTQSIFILDDIHYSPEMEKAWHTLRNHPLVYGSADLFRCGILFFDPSLNKQHVVLQF